MNIAKLTSGLAATGALVLMAAAPPPPPDAAMPPPEDELAPEGEADTGPMDDRNIVQAASASEDFQTLSAAITAAGLAETLSSDGPFTVFAPTDAAFAKLPPETLDALMLSENSEQLAGLLGYHVVEGRLTSGQLTAAAQHDGGTTSLTTVSGAVLTVMRNGNELSLVDARGNAIGIIKANINQKNGIIHAIDSVLLP